MKKRLPAGEVDDIQLTFGFDGLVEKVAEFFER
jgi:hypothetical protein